MKVIIPMAGLGSRFAEQGYDMPKPFIDIDGKPMIRRVVESANLLQYEHIFIARSEHVDKYRLTEIFSDIKHRIMVVNETTEGAAVSVSLTRPLFLYDEAAIIINSDQLFHYDSSQVEKVLESRVDGCIWCFKGSGNKWSYARVDDKGVVREVAEKKQISEYATGGMYYWKSFYNFMDCTNRMIYANDRVNNEFYVAPVYNYMLPFQKTIIKMLDDIDQLGTPEDLKIYEDKIRLHRDN